MIAFRYLSLMPLLALCFTSRTQSANILEPRGLGSNIDDSHIDLDKIQFVKEFMMLNPTEKLFVLDYFKNNRKPFGLPWSAYTPFFPQGFRFPGCPPPPPEGCPIPPKGCRPPPPQWYCPKHKKPKSAKNCPKPPPKPPICKPWQKGFYHLRPEGQHV